MQRSAFQHALKAIGILLCLLVLAGCGTRGPTIRTNADESADLTRFRTFTFMQPLSTDREGYQSLISRRLIDAAERELVGLGFQRVESGADIMVNFSARLDQRLRVTQSPTTSMGAWGSHRRGFYSAWPVYRTDVRQYTQGTLVVDIVDVARNQLVWEGIAESRITARSTEDAGPLIDTAVREIFARFPARVN
jgi:predicted small lipoprotein YifL